MIARKNLQNRGSIAIHFVIFLTVMFLMVAFALDIGWVYVAKAQLQHAADASAMAGAVELKNTSPNVNGVVAEYTGYHEAGDVTSLAVASGDVTVGYMYDPTNLQSEIQTGTTDPPNSVEVRLKRSSDANGTLPLFLGFVTGINDMTVQAKARATYETRIFGFSSPPGKTNSAGQNVGSIIPFAVDKAAWDGPTTDNFTCTPNESLGTYTIIGSIQHPAGDLKKEIVLYPWGTTSGNFGSVDIGLTNNSARDLNDQIATGINQEDLDNAGITVTMNGTEIGGIFLNQPLNGDTGMTASIENAIKGTGAYNACASQIGVPRIFLLYETVINPGNNATYNIVGWELGIICYANLNGSNKQIVVQKGGEIHATGSNVTGSGVFLPSAPSSGTLWMYALTR